MRRTISRRALDERKYSCKLGGPNFDFPMGAAKWGEFLDAGNMAFSELTAFVLIIWKLKNGERG